MVSELSRKELDQLIISQVQASNRTYVPQQFWTPKNDNFPYALREFVNSHMDLPTIEELAVASPKLAHCFGRLRAKVA